jgi:glycosyltransferase involved in cell wall biosynthesis
MPDTVFVIIGNREKTSDLPENVVELGRVEDQQALSAWYAAADAVLLTSKKETFSMVTVESLCCGTPVVGSAVGGIPEIIVDGETGFLVPLQAKSETDFDPVSPEAFQKDFAEKLNRFLTNPDLAKKMGEASRKRAVSVFSWEAIAKETFHFYEKVIERYLKEGAR